MKKIFYLLIASCLILTSCSSNKEIQNNWELNKIYRLTDFGKNDEFPDEDFKLKMTLEAFPDVSFNWTSGSITATENGTENQLISGMPVLDVCFTDLTNDGFPEICSTVMMGSGICEIHIEVVDYKNTKRYILSEAMSYDYNLIMENNELLAEKRPYYYYEDDKDDKTETGKLVIEDDILKFKQ